MSFNTEGFSTEDREMRNWLLITAVALCAACASTTVQDYAAEKPDFVLEKFFDGPLVAKGALYDRGGNVIRRFVADIRGSWQGNKGELKEVFWWADGEEQFRTWQISRTNGNAFEGTAGDIVGLATGEGAGNAFNWNYILEVPAGGSKYNIRMDDWIYLLDDSTVLNRTAMTFFGFRVGEVVLTIQKVEESELYGSSPFEKTTKSASAEP